MNEPLGYFYRLIPIKPRGNRPPLATTYWHADPLCSSIPRGAFAVGPIPVVIDPNEPRVVTCSCLDDAGVVGGNVRNSSSKPPPVKKATKKKRPR